MQRVQEERKAFVGSVRSAVGAEMHEDDPTIEPFRASAAEL